MMYRLQVILVPPSLKDGIAFNLNSTLEESSHLLNNDNLHQQSQQMNNSTMNGNSILLSTFMAPQKLKRFLVFTKPTNSLLELSDEILSKCEKMYPSLSNEIEIISLQDNNSCDLDPDFLVKDVFNLDNTVRVILKNDIDLDSIEPVSPYTKKRKLNNGVMQPQSSSMKKVRNQAANTTVIRNTTTNLRISTPLANQIYPSAAISNNSDDEDADKSFLPPPTQPQSPPIRISSGITDSKKIKYSNMDDSVSRSETVDPDKSKQQRILSGTPLRSTTTPNRVMLTGQRVISENKNGSPNNGLIFTSNQSTHPQPNFLSRQSTSRITSGMLTIPEPKIAEVEMELGEGPSSPSSTLPAKSDRIPMKKPYIQNNDSSESETEAHTHENNENNNENIESTADQSTSKSSPFNNVPPHTDRKSSLEARLEKKSFPKRGVRRMNGFSEDDDYDFKKSKLSNSVNSSDLEAEANNTVKFTDLQSDAHGSMQKKDLLNILDNSSTSNVKDVILKETATAVLEKSSDMVVEAVNIEKTVMQSPTKKTTVEASLNHLSSKVPSDSKDIASTASESESSSEYESESDNNVQSNSLNHNASNSKVQEVTIPKRIKENNKKNHIVEPPMKKIQSSTKKESPIEISKRSALTDIAQKVPGKTTTAPLTKSAIPESSSKRTKKKDTSTEPWNASKLLSTQPTAYIETHIRKPAKAIDTYNPEGKVKIDRHEDRTETDSSSDSELSVASKTAEDRTVILNELDLKASQRADNVNLRVTKKTSRDDTPDETSSDSSVSSQNDRTKTVTQSTKTRSIRLTSEPVHPTKKSRKIYQTPEFIATTDEELSSDENSKTGMQQHTENSAKKTKLLIVAVKENDSEASNKLQTGKKQQSKNNTVVNARGEIAETVKHKAAAAPNLSAEKLKPNLKNKSNTIAAPAKGDIQRRTVIPKGVPVRPSLAPNVADKKSGQVASSSSDMSTDSGESDTNGTNEGSSGSESESELSSCEEEISSSSRGKRMVVAPPKGKVLNSKNKKDTVLVEKSSNDITDVPQSTQRDMLSSTTIKKSSQLGKIPSADLKKKPNLRSSQVSDSDSKTPLSSQNDNVKVSPISKLPQKFRPSLSSLSDLVSRGIPEVKEKTNKNPVPSLASRGKDILNKSKKEKSSSSSSESSSSDDSSNSSSDDSSSSEKSSSESDNSSDSSNDEKESYISAKSAKATLKKKKKPSGGFASLIKDFKKKK